MNKVTFYKVDTQNNHYHFRITGNSFPGVYFLRSNTKLWYQMDTESLVPVENIDTWEIIKRETGMTELEFRLAGKYFQEGYESGYEDRGRVTRRRFPV